MQVPINGKEVSRVLIGKTDGVDYVYTRQREATQ